MTNVIQVKGLDIEIEMSDSTFKPMRKKPTLAIRQGNQVTKVASFNNWNSVLLFTSAIEQMFNQINKLCAKENENV